MITKCIGYFDFARLFLSIFFKRKYPLSVSWAITKRCNTQCLYCQGNIVEEELTARETFKIIDELVCQGTKFISFTGGEPLLRQDIKDIIDYAKGKGLFVKLNTNGYLLKEKIDQIKSVDIIHLSLDGAESVNNRIRSEGSFSHAVEGINAAINARIKISINTVISELNVGRLSEVIDLAKKYNVDVSFQPATKGLFRNNRPNPVTPDVIKYKKAIAYLIELKKNRLTQRLILNSIGGLRHLYNWPQPHRIPCYDGILSFRIDNKGKLYNCDESKEKGIEILKRGVKKSVALLTPLPCNECWGSSKIEFNLLMSLKLNSLRNILSLLF